MELQEPQVLAEEDLPAQHSSPRRVRWLGASRIGGDGKG